MGLRGNPPGITSDQIADKAAFLSSLQKWDCECKLMGKLHVRGGCRNSELLGIEHLPKVVFPRRLPDFYADTTA